MNGGWNSKKEAFLKAEGAIDMGPKSPDWPEIALVTWEGSSNHWWQGAHGLCVLTVRAGLSLKVDLVQMAQCMGGEVGTRAQALTIHQNIPAVPGNNLPV